MVYLMAFFTLISGKLGIEYNPPQEKVDDFRVKSYITAESIQNSENVHSEDFDIITDAILFGSATFDTDGNVNVETQELETALENLRSAIGERDVKITLNLLGPSGDTDSGIWEEQMAVLSEAHTKAFESGVLEDNIIAILDKYDFDGVHFDYEYPMGDAAWKGFNKFLVSMDKKLGERSLAVAAAHWDLEFSTSALNAVDCIELMLYDIYDEDGRHATTETSVSASKALLNNGIPAEKVTFGLPFYARPADHDAYWYGYNGYYDKLDENSWYHCDETDKDFWFNTPDVIAEKTEYAVKNGFAGVMIWNYACDLPSNNEMSLLRAVGQTVDENY